ncbi:hypothetical protein O181_027826 [Austropuccinia psidii MF-1]|uniref:Endonuclease/exonuclease/phosphatase domain-containing protein n=1 Tax=Austropuccinia psidii MF-1 TaxID=1389203 RepID=A0A9Q3H1T6_9BASI|nr:hypothetical protein [Austropuccinia psidii MF-1]
MGPLYPKTRDGKPRSCIYVKRLILIHNITQYQLTSNLVTAITIKLSSNRNESVTLLSVYNTPPKFEGLEPLKPWLAEYSIRSLPTLIAIDSNLHHPLWNPPSYRHSHPEAKNLLKIMEGKIFYLSSPPGIPTFLGRHGSATTIDHLCENPKAKSLMTLIHIQLNNHASDHQPIATNVNLNFQKTVSKISQIKEIERLKHEHWRKFLAKNSSNNVFQAYKLTNTIKSGNILPLRDNEGNLTSDNKVKGKILFEGTSVIHNHTDTLDINPNFINTPSTFPPITTYEISRALEELPKKKAPGPDQIPNKLLKAVSTHPTPYLKEVFNGCLCNGYFPSIRKRFLTAIIRKSGKDDYSDPREYCPISLLNTLGKLFEKIINNRLSFWKEHTGSLANGHMGSRPGRGIYNAFLSYFHGPKPNDVKEK